MLKALFALSSETTAKLEPSLFALVEIRASQINGCAYYIDMHTKDAGAAGETEQRIYALNARRETPFYTDRERAALEWTEAVTLLSDTHVPDEIYQRAAEQFDEPELVALTFGVIVLSVSPAIRTSGRNAPVPATGCRDRMAPGRVIDAPAGDPMCSGSAGSADADCAGTAPTPRVVPGVRGVVTENPFDISRIHGCGGQPSTTRPGHRTGCRRQERHGAGRGLPDAIQAGGRLSQALLGFITFPFDFGGPQA